MSSAYKKPFNPEWMSYYIQLNQSLETLKQTCPSFLSEFEKNQLIHKINRIQGLIYMQQSRIRQRYP